jgi:micrococcal nuclease
MIALLAACFFSPVSASDAEATRPGPVTAAVVSVYDGDTFTLSTGDKVRLRNVNTPELKPLEAYGLEAKEGTRSLVEGKTVSLSYGSVTRDGYGRLLASVSIDGQDLSVFLLERGLAHLYIIPPLEGDISAHLAAQETARLAHRGIWSTPSFAGTLHITSFHANADGDDRTNVNGEYFRVCNISSSNLEVAGFRIADIAGNSWELPSLVIPPGNTVKIHSGKGTNQLNAAEQLAVYLQSADPIWNNKEDRLTIYDRYGRVVDTRVHSVETETP